MLMLLTNAGYTSIPPPRYNDTSPTVVHFGLGLIDIEDFVESAYGYGDISIQAWENYVSRAITVRL